MGDVFNGATSVPIQPDGSNISDYTSLVPGSKGAPQSLMQNLGSQAQGFQDAYKSITSGFVPQEPMQFNKITPSQPRIQLQQQDLLSGVRSMGGNK